MILFLLDLSGYFGIGFGKVFRDGFSIGFVLEFSENVVSHFFEVFLDDIEGFDILINVKMFEP